MAKLKPDYVALLSTYDTVKATTGMTIKAFCAQEGLPYKTVLKGFKKVKESPPEPKNPYIPSKDRRRKNRRHDWKAYRIEYVQSDFKSIAEFLRSKDLTNTTGGVKIHTKGWNKEKAIIEAERRQKINEELIDKAKRQRFGELQGRVLTALYKCMTGYEEIQKHLKSDKDHGPRDHKDSAGTFRTIQMALKELVPMIMDFEESAQSKELIQKLIAGDLDITEVALRYAEMGGNLPEAVKILLGKVQPEEPDIEEGDRPSDEELENLYMKGIAKITTQEIEFVPQRQREIEQLKKECKDADSFSGIDET
jgi:hypothetical protein